MKQHAATPQDLKPRLGDREGHQVLTDDEWQTLAVRLSLAPRELQVAKGIFDDDKEADIAARLNLSTHTVHTYLRRLYRKLSASSRVQVMLAVFKAHLSCAGQAMPKSVRGGDQASLVPHQGDT